MHYYQSYWQVHSANVYSWKTHIIWYSSQRRVTQPSNQPFLYAAVQSNQSVVYRVTRPSCVVRQRSYHVAFTFPIPSPDVSSSSVWCSVSGYHKCHNCLSRDYRGILLARLDYCNGVLASLQLSRLQSELWAHSGRVTPLRQLHWLYVLEHDTVYSCLHGLRPMYLSGDFTCFCLTRSRDWD